MPKKAKLHAAIHPQQVAQMYRTLQKIAKGYETPAQIRKSADKRWGLEFEEAMEMAYENLQAEAAYAIKGVRIKDVLAQLDEESRKQPTKQQ